MIRSFYKADMKILDNIPNHVTYQQAVAGAEKYWNGESTDAPVFEFLFQGTCKLIPLS